MKDVETENVARRALVTQAYTREAKLLRVRFPDTSKLRGGRTSDLVDRRKALEPIPCRSVSTLIIVLRSQTAHSLRAPPHSSDALSKPAEREMLV